MAKLIFLGTASAVAFEGHENSFLVIKGDQSAILLDCAAKPVLRLKEAGVHFNEVSDLIITHFHPDHVSGLANLLMDMWILGRKKELTIHSSNHAISRTKKMLDLYDWQEWTGLYPVVFDEISEKELTRVLETPEFRILSSPVEHMIPTLGLRIEYLAGKTIVVYSSDTAPVPQTVRLAAGADVLIHEATGSIYHHSTPAQAGEIAEQAGVNSLYLTHYSFSGDLTPETILNDAKKTFPGNIILAEDFMEIEFT